MTPTDPVNHPLHYTAGSVEVIDILEQVVAAAPSPVVGGLQWQCLKYLLRMWLKGNPLQDAQKAQWYLTRLINTLDRYNGDTTVMEGVDDFNQGAWQPMDTAPRDGTEILASDYDAVEIVSWRTYTDAGYWTERGGEIMFPAWWQHLPNHPLLPEEK
jgi:hypothetical protein